MTAGEPAGRPDPDTRNCADCGHVWFAGERGHLYVDAQGEASERDDADAVCGLCQRKRLRPRRDDDVGDTGGYVTHW